MSFWTAVVVIAAMIAYVHLRSENRRARERLDDDPTITELEREIVELKQRIAVLERIATDERHSRAIADEIEQLRDR